MCPKLLISLVTISFEFWIPILVILAQKNAFSDPKFGPANDKNAIETCFLAILIPQKSMGGMVIAIWEKSNFFGSIGSLKCTKNAIFLQGGQNLPPCLL